MKRRSISNAWKAGASSSPSSLGARFSDFTAKFVPGSEKARYVAMATPDGGYYVGLDTPSALHPQTLLAYRMNGENLEDEARRATLRLVIPVKYGIKNIKRIRPNRLRPETHAAGFLAAARLRFLRGALDGWVEKTITPGAIILLSGPVGAGKTTVARELLTILPRPTANIEGDTFRSFLVGAAAGEPGTKNFRTIMVSMAAAAVPYALAGCDVIVDFSIPPWFLDTARAVANVRSVPLDYVVLRPAEAVCAARAAGRAEGVITDYTRYRDLYKDFDGVETCTIRNDDSDAESCSHASARPQRRQVSTFVIVRGPVVSVTLNCSERAHGSSWLEYTSFTPRRVRGSNPCAPTIHTNNRAPPRAPSNVSCTDSASMSRRLF